MKKIIYIFFAIALLAFTTCKKDAKLQKLIIGTWEVKSKDRLVATDYPDHLSFEYTFKENGIVIEENRCASGVNNIYSSPGIYSPGYSPCTTKYKIENRNLYIEYQVDSAVYEWYEVEIKSLTSNRMVIYDPKDGNSGEGVKWTYKKIN
jgi:hypothetical protein